MGKIRFKTVRLFLKLMLFFQIYSYRKFEAEAKENPIIIKSFDGIKADDGSGTESSDKIFEKEIKDDVSERQKRPARLLPLRMFFEKEKNKTDESENSTIARFYGPATTCMELLSIGYTRNGFYLVKGNDTSNSGNVEVVDCLFKNPNGVKEINEKRIGFVPLKIAEKLRKRRSTDAFKFSRVEIDENHIERSKRPARLLPFHLFFGKETNLTEEENSSRPFYGPPTNCIELEKIGYTLNGYYLVNNGSENSNQVEVILCRFKIPPGNTESLKEERLGFISLDQNRVVIEQLSSNEATLERNSRPVRLLPVKQKSSNGGKEKKTRKLIYNNPANCSDMGQLGYTLNGLYLVNGSDTVGRLGIAYCRFQFPLWADRTAKEEPFGFFNLTETNITNTTTSLTKAEHDFLKFDFEAFMKDWQTRYNWGFGGYGGHGGHGGYGGYHMAGKKHGRRYG